MSSDRSFKAFQDDISTCLVDVTRTTGQIAGEDLSFQRSSNPSIGLLLDKQNARLLTLSRALLNSTVSGTELSPLKLPDAEAVEDDWKGIIDVVDHLLEKADACLDEYTGVIKRLSPSQPTQSSIPASSRKQQPSRSYQDQNVSKPQLLFERVPKNDETTAFRPLIRTKPNAIVPLEQSLQTLIPENSSQQYKHPYETEITQSRYPPETYLKADPLPYLPFETTKATFVDTPEAVALMLAELKTAKEIAVDLEHHDTHSYIGLVSLMQISSREKDWVVDTLKPWREDLQVLNEVFTDPNILKVFHGSSMDMIWLQRDLGLYVVGLFDTYWASTFLGYQKKSLAFLLNKFAQFEAQKQYQLADWRIRPLPEKMFDYARSDTHFLLYVYDNMRNELIDKSVLAQSDGNLTDAVLVESKKEALKRYERPFYDLERGSGREGWYNLLVRTPALFTKEQFAVFKAVHQWRDDLARLEDESTNMIMPKTALFNIAREIPMDMPSLLGCSQPISSAARSRVGGLLAKIRRAKAAGANGLGMKEFLASQSFASTEHTVSNKPVLPVFPPLDPVANGQAMPIRRTLSDTALRSSHSHFWGSTFMNSAPKPYTHSCQPHNLRLALPLPQLTAQIFEDADSKKKNATPGYLVKPDIPIEHQYVKDRKHLESNIFIVKELGGTRKRKAEQAQGFSEKKQAHHKEPPSNNVEMPDFPHDQIEVSISETEQARFEQEKVERKVKRKAQKKLAKEQRKIDEARRVNGAAEDTHIFDYTSAPSVLHAKEDASIRPGLAKPFKPYTKSLDAPKSMRRSKKEVAGKSFTFKS